MNWFYAALVIDKHDRELAISKHDNASTAIAMAKYYHSRGHNYEEVRATEQPSGEIIWSSLNEKVQDNDEFRLVFEKTPRGFSRATFIDRYNSHCSIQKSSIAGEDCIWLGTDTSTDGTSRMHLTQEMVKALLPALMEFAYTGELPND